MGKGTVTRRKQWINVHFADEDGRRVGRWEGLRVREPWRTNDGETLSSYPAQEGRRVLGRD